MTQNSSQFIKSLSVERLDQGRKQTCMFDPITKRMKPHTIIVKVVNVYILVLVLKRHQVNHTSTTKQDIYLYPP